MTEHASPLTVIRSRGRAFVAVGDMVNMLREMAATVDGGQQSASDVLRTLAESFTRATAGTDELFHAPSPPAEPCPSCQEPTHTCDRLDGGTLILSAAGTPYGAWIICVGGDGRQVATRYDVGKHARISCSRYREHSCAGLS